MGRFVEGQDRRQSRLLPSSLDDYVTGDNPVRVPDAMAVRRATVEHVFGTLEAWMGSTPFLTKGSKGVRTEMSLAILAYNVKRMIRLFGATWPIQAIRA